MELPARRMKEIVPPTCAGRGRGIIIVIRLFWIYEKTDEREKERERRRAKNRRRREGRRDDLSRWTVVFCDPRGVYSVDEALVMAVDARVLMDTPDVDERKKKCGFSRRRLTRGDI